MYLYRSKQRQPAATIDRSDKINRSDKMRSGGQGPVAIIFMSSLLLIIMHSFIQSKRLRKTHVEIVFFLAVVCFFFIHFLVVFTV